ncbi:uncharacterized protein FTJAE_4858 [Fusarium tjaetaba]|uniref:Uncharacterized protein n=1 Tax=Fusarium tjaetaba TaxID=1567544 RepID=A0A8H5RQ60_9HYPO|nr:uncharacterized protein FTJAE_4858 [Fusarium tjaetaba]KAF5639520.1 hypothetical protein FTJAE_4858 [Fusarium tjaetaba]
MPSYVRQLFIGGSTRTLVICERTTDNSLSGGPSLTTTKLRAIDQWLVDQVLLPPSGMPKSTHVGVRRFWANISSPVDSRMMCTAETTLGNFGWCWSMDIARVLAVRSPETDEQHRPGSFDDAAYTALRYLREGGQISDPELNGGPRVRHSSTRWASGGMSPSVAVSSFELLVTKHRDYQRRGCAEFRSCLDQHAQPVSVFWLHGWDKDEELRGIRNSFGLDDAGSFCNSQFNTRTSAPLVAGAHLVNVTLPQESDLNSTYRCQGFLRS